MSKLVKGSIHGITTIIGPRGISSNSNSKVERYDYEGHSQLARLATRLYDGQVECLVIDGFHPSTHTQLVRSRHMQHLSRTPLCTNVRSDEVIWLSLDHDCAAGDIRPGTDTSVGAVNDNVIFLTDSGEDDEDKAIASAVKSLFSLAAVLSCPSKNILLSNPSQVQLAHYNVNANVNSGQPGQSGRSGYIRHKDAHHCQNMNLEDDPLWFYNHDQRFRYLTAILYATPGSSGDGDCDGSATSNDREWDAGEQKDGGALRLYLGSPEREEEAGEKEDGSREEIVDVSPLAGRLVLFRSAVVPHEVRPLGPSLREGRFAYTLWILKH